MRSGRGKRGKASRVAFDQHLVPAAEGDVQFGMVEKILEPDAALLVATGHCDLGNFRLDGHAACIGQHGAQRASRTLNRIDTLRADGSHQRYGGAVTGQPPHLHLWIRCLVFQFPGDHLAQLFGRVA